MSRLHIVLGAMFAVGLGCNALTGIQSFATVPDDELTGASTSSGAPSSSSGNSSSGGVLDGSLTDTGSSSGNNVDAAGDASKSCVVSEPDLLAYYPLDETSGTVATDCSGNNLHGTVLSAPLAGAWTTGKFGGGFASGAAAGCIDLGKPASLALEAKSFTVAAWVKPNVFPGPMASYYVVGRTALPDVAGWRIGNDPSSVWSIKLFDATNGVTLTTSAADQPAALWTHVAATFVPSAQSKLYVNGVEVASSALTTIEPDNDSSVRIGCRGDGQGFLHGTVDEVRIYNRALTGLEIAALFAKQL